jgi:hypothetical protein
MNQFTSDADMKVEAQKRLLTALKAANDPDADSLQRDIVLENRSTGFDLGVQGSLGTIEDKFKAKDWDGAKVAYETSVRDFKDQGGGTFFHDVIQPYVMMCLQYGREEQAEDGLHFTEERMSLREGSLIQVEFERLKRQISWAKDAFAASDQWLGEVDNAQYAQAWKDAAKLLQDRGSEDSFASSMGALRQPLGKMISRTMAAAPSMGDEIKSGASDLKGEFVELRYADAFEHEPAARERVDLMREDGLWKVMSYSLGK